MTRPGVPKQDLGGEVHWSLPTPVEKAQKRFPNCERDRRIVLSALTDDRAMVADRLGAILQGGCGTNALEALLDELRRT